MPLCKCLIGSMCCVAVLAAAGVLAWQFGPWNKKDETAVKESDFEALNACEGCCNGLVTNCDLKLNEVTFPMVHNAHSSKADLFTSPNNNKGLREALVAGFRGLMLDSCTCDGSIGEYLQDLWKGEDNVDASILDIINGEQGKSYLGFCHKSCDFGLRQPAQVLGNIKTFLDVNKNEVLILEFEINDDSIDDLVGAIAESGLDKYVYYPSSPNAEWPTMRTLIDNDKRLMLFAHGNGCDTNECPDGILYTYDYFAQTNWNDDTCDVRGNGDASGSSFFLMNHWMNNEADLPSPTNAEEFNAYDTLDRRFKKCGERNPNIVAVDFWDVGDVLNFVRDRNVRNA